MLCAGYKIKKHPLLAVLVQSGGQSHFNKQHDFYMGSLKNSLLVSHVGNLRGAAVWV